MADKRSRQKKAVSANIATSFNMPGLSSVNSRNIAYKVNKTRQMNWGQLKRKFPNLNPNSDADFDGLTNSRDCKPFDPSRDGPFTDFLGGVASKIKAGVKKVESVTRPPKTAKRASVFIKRRALERVATTRKEIVSAKARRERAIVKTIEKATGVRKVSKTGKTAQGQKGIGAGRPKQSYKYRDPRTGQPVPAVQYYKIRKLLKNQARAVESKAEIQQRLALAKRGLSPEEVAAKQNMINERMAQLRAIKAANQEAAMQTEVQVIPSEQQIIQEQAQQVPVQVVQRAMPQRQYQPQMQQSQRPNPMGNIPGATGIPPGYRLQEDLMTGRKTLVPLPPKEAWSR